MHSLFLSMGVMKFCLNRFKREHNCLEDFIKELEKLAKDIFNRKRNHRFFRSNPRVTKEYVNDCWICNKPFENDQKKIFDPCHYSGKFSGLADPQCSLKRKGISFTPVIARNVACFDFHHIW